MVFFDSVEMKPEDPILGLRKIFAKDRNEKKVNLGIGAYKNAEGLPQVLNCVRKAESSIVEQHLNKEYPPIIGCVEYIQAVLKLIYGETSSLLKERCIVGAQTIGGTGALKVGGEFLTQSQISQKMFLSDPSWPNHLPIFSRSGMKIDTYSYYDEQHHTFNFKGMCESIKRIPPGSTILLQGCCHNPLGLDPSMEQWKEISTLIKHQQVIPFFDLAYQGLGESLESDVAPIRYFVEEGHEMLVASSFSKNLGLYGERIGFLSIVTKDRSHARSIESQIKQVIRGIYSMPPLHGQRIVTAILQDEDLYKEWMIELESMRSRIQEMRKSLLSGFQAGSTGHDFSYFGEQMGMFSFSGLNVDQVHRLQQEYGIYLPSNGRINVAGLNGQNIDYVIESILKVIEK